MKKNLKIELYDGSNKEELEYLLAKFSEEVYETGKYDIDKFVDNHWAIYLCVDTDTFDVVGFSSYMIVDYHGFKEDTLANTFIYIIPQYRRTKAMHLFSLQTGKIVEQHNYPVEHYYASIGSLRLSQKLEGKKEYETYSYEPNEILREYERLKKKVRIK